MTLLKPILVNETFWTMENWGKQSPRLSFLCFRFLVITEVFMNHSSTSAHQIELAYKHFISVFRQLEGCELKHCVPLPNISYRLNVLARMQRGKPQWLLSMCESLLTWWRLNKNGVIQCLHEEISEAQEEVPCQSP